MMGRQAFAFIVALLPGLFATVALAGESRELRNAFSAVRDGQAIVIMRHALAPGTGDPAEFSLNDCATQRNLSAVGRDQARRIGRFLAEHLAVSSTDGKAGQTVRVMSSGWCRCLDTARLLSLGPVQRLEPLDSFFQDRQSGPDQTMALKQWIARHLGSDDTAVAVLVTHQVNITALTGVFPASGEVLVVDAEGRVLARTTRALEMR